MAKTYYVNINSITTSDGVTCTNPKITFEKPNCANIVCELLKDASGNPVKIKVQVPDDCPDGCIYVKIDCSEQCSTCGEQRLKICPCTTDSDCPDCHTCGPNGYCVSQCEEDEFCSGGNCVECDEFHPCTGGKVCESGKCKCPPDKPYQNQKGECVQCNNQTPLAACQECVDGIIVLKECQAGVLNPDTCDCVECVKSSDCVKPNQKCGPNGCECEDGFRLNLKTGDCEPIDDCTRDEDCGPCKKCMPDGKCGDYTCPPGYTPSNIPGKCCVKICDCNNPSCPPGHICVNLDGTNCFCQDCNVKCQNGKCPDGCICKDGDNCGTNPCSGKCGPGMPCAPGCGCNENNDCVPCNSLNCTKCAQTPGCECTTPDNCEGSPCNGPCDEKNPCLGQNCGCKNKLCVNCAEVSCLKDTDCPEGCNCQDGGKCGKTPCANIYCATPADCGKDCDCIEGSCKPGTPTPKNGCEDTLKIEDNGDCTIKGTLSTKDCCECRDIYAHAALTTSATQRTVNTTLRIGPAVADTALGVTGIIGDDSIFGNIRYTWEQVAKEVNGAGVVLVGGSEINITTNVITAFSGSDNSSVNANVKANGQTVVQGGKTYKIVETTMYVESVGLLSNTVSKCTYQIGKTILYRKSGGENGTYSALSGKVQRCKNPILTWFKSSNGSTWTQIKKTYSQEPSADTFTDILTEADGLELCKYYKLSSDCGCSRDAFYKCDGGTNSKYVPYQPEDLEITQLDPCGLSIRIDEVQLCALFKTTSEPFKLYINGEFHANYNVNASHKLFAGNVTITKTLPIKEVKLVYPCDDCNDPLIINLPSLGADCFLCTDATITMSLAGDCTNGIDVTGTIMKTSAPLVPVAGCSTKIYLNGNLASTVVTDANGAFATNLPVATDGTYVVMAVNCLGCDKSDSIAISGCCEASVSTLSYNPETRELVTVLTGCATPGTFTIKRKVSGTLVHTGTYATPYTIPFPLCANNSGDAYVFEVDCGGGCSANAEFVVNPASPSFDIVNGCNGLTPFFTASNYAGGVGPAYTLQVASDNSFGTILATSGADPFTYNGTEGQTVWVRLLDQCGNSHIKSSFMPVCSQNSFDFSALMKCISGVQKFCFTPTRTAYYTALVKDVNNVTVYSGSIYAQAGVEICTNFSVAPANGVGTVSLTTDGITIVKNINVVACASATISYDCTTGLSVVGVASFNVHSAGYPGSGYGPFATGDTGLFFTDGANETRTLTIKSPDGSETYGTVAVNCCTHDFVPMDDLCSGPNAKVKISLTGIAGAYEVRVLNGLSLVCAPETINHGGGTSIYTISCNLASSTLYSIEVVNLAYGNRIYKDAGTGNTSCSVTKSYTSTNCGSTGGGGGTLGCGVVESDIVISGGCNPSITNNSSFAVQVQFQSTENTNCTGAQFSDGNLQTINPGQTINYGALSNPNLGKKLVVTYTSTGGDPCTLSICYTGCTGASTCTLTDDPSAACSTTGALPGNRRLTVTNINAKSVLCFVDGVFKGVIGAGGNLIGYYPNNTTHTILFKCVDDVNEQRSITYLLNC